MNLHDIDTLRAQIAARLLAAELHGAPPSLAEESAYIEHAVSMTDRLLVALAGRSVDTPRAYFECVIDGNAIAVRRQHDGLPLGNVSLQGSRVRVEFEDAFPVEFDTIASAFRWLRIRGAEAGQS